MEGLAEVFGLRLAYKLTAEKCEVCYGYLKWYVLSVLSQLLATKTNLTPVMIGCKVVPKGLFLTIEE